MFIGSSIRATVDQLTQCREQTAAKPRVSNLLSISCTGTKRTHHILPHPHNLATVPKEYTT